MPRAKKQKTRALAYRAQTRRSLRSSGPDFNGNPPILRLPTEVLQAIAVYTYNASLPHAATPLTGLRGSPVYNQESFRDLVHLALTCRQWRDVAEPTLYVIEAQCDPMYQIAIGWAAFHGRIGTIEKALSARETFPSIKYTIDDHVSGRCRSLTRPARIFFTDNSRRPVRFSARPREPFSESLPPAAATVPYVSPWIPSSLKSHTTALHIACATGQDEMVKFLVQKGAGINRGSNITCSCRPVAKAFEVQTAPSQISYHTPLHTAICYGNTSTAKLLLRLGASIAVENPPPSCDLPENIVAKNDGETALHSACWAGDLDLIHYIIESKYQTDIDQEDAHGITPLQYAFEAGLEDTVVPYLVQHGADIDHRLNGNQNLLSRCLDSYWFARATKLIELGAVQKKARLAENSTNRYPIQVALHSGCARDSLRFIQTCLDHGWDPNFTDEKGRSLLFHALARGCHQTTRILLEAGADPAVQPDLDGTTPLIVACQQLALNDGNTCCLDRTGMLSAILDLGIPINHVSSPRNGDPGITALGAVATSKTKSIPVGYEYSIQTGFEAQLRHLQMCARILVSRGADLNVSVNGKSLLLASFDAHGPGICGLLLRAGAKFQRGRDTNYMFRKALDENRGDMFEFALELDPQSNLVSSGKLFRTAIKKDKYKFALAYLRAGLSAVSREIPKPLLELCASNDAKQLREQVIMEVLDRSGADVQAVNQDGECALLLVVKHKLSPRIAEKLVQHGADVNFQPANAGGIPSPLHLAVENCDIQYVRALVRFDVSDILPCNKFLIHELLSPPIVYSSKYNPALFPILQFVSDPLALDEKGDTAYSVCLRHASKSISGRWDQFSGLPAPYTRLIFRRRREIPWEQKNKEGKSMLDYLRDIHSFVKKHRAKSPDLAMWLNAFFTSYSKPEFLGSGRVPMHKLNGNHYFFTRDDPGSHLDHPDNYEDDSDFGADELEERFNETVGFYGIGDSFGDWYGIGMDMDDGFDDYDYDSYMDNL